MIDRSLRRDMDRVQVVERPLSGAGTAFPSSPATGARFFRTDLGLECYYDGTRWLTMHEYALGNFGGNTLNTLADFTASDSFAFLWRLRTQYAPYFTRVAVTTRVSTTNNATNFWTIGFDCYNISFGAGTTIYTFSTAADTVTAYTDHEGAPSTPAPANNTHLALSIQKTLTPGALRILFQAYYRLIIT
jgi:hypothetical protein